MAASAKLALNEDAFTAAELVARFSTFDLYTVSKEVSDAYEGQVLSVALRIVQQRTGLRPTEIASRIGLTRGAIHRWRCGKPHSPQFVNRAIRELAILLLEEGKSPRRPI